MAKRYRLYFGSFDNEDFVWKVLSTHETFDDCYRAYHKLCVDCVGMDKDELYDKYKSTRVDIEIRDGEKRLNWTGIYSRRVDKTLEKEPEEEDDSEEGGEDSPKEE